MFDEAFEILEGCSEAFQSSVRDAFGTSIVVDVIDPIRNEIGSLRSFYVEFQCHSTRIEQTLEQARSLVPDEGSRR